jgi:hypothetical protein
MIRLTQQQSKNVRARVAITAALPGASVALAFALAACSDGDHGRAKTSGSGGAASSASSGAGGSVGSVTTTVNPQSVAVDVSAQQTYSCLVAGTTNGACTWELQESGGGTIAAAGSSTAVYTAPATPGTYHVVATSVADTRASGTATVTVVNKVVGNCSNLPAPGTWQNITPKALNMGSWCAPYNTGCPQPGMSANGLTGTYGTNAFVLDPNNPGTVYLGTSSLGFYKSIDCGSTWAHIDTGSNANAIDGGRNWSLLIDPTNSEVLYTVSGYDQGGVFKSTDGGVNWAQILTQNVMNATGATPCAMSPDQQVCGGGGGFVEKVTMDPTNVQHLLVSFHTDCAGTTPLPGATVDSTGGWGCLAESVDAGQTWTLTTSALPWSGADGPGQTMVDSKTWFYSTNTCDGLWRTTTGGVSPDSTSSAWTKVYSGCVNGAVFKAANGVFYSGGPQNLWSKDGINWTEITGSPGAASINGSTAMTDDGAWFYTVGGGAYFKAPLMAGVGDLTFTMISSTPITSVPQQPVEEAVPGYLDVDKVHHLLYTSNLDGGFWRYVTQ